MNNLKINHLAVLVCIILMHALGFVWYGPLFGESWMKMVGLDMATIEANPPGVGVWIANFASSIASVYMLAWLFVQLGVTSGIRGAVLAFLITFSIHHLALMNNNMFAGEPYELAWITGGFSLVALTLSGFVLGAWTKQKGR